jgi:hypothetical protein
MRILFVNTHLGCQGSRDRVRELISSDDSDSLTRFLTHDILGFTAMINQWKLQELLISHNRGIGGGIESGRFLKEIPHRVSVRT